MSTIPPSETADLELDRELGAGRTVIAEMPVTIPNNPKKHKQQPPQEAIDEFWSKFTTKAPGKATTVIPHNQYIKKAADNRLRDSHGKTTQASYEEAVVVCKAKVAKIVKECRRINQKYRDPHFDLELDLKCGPRDTLETLSNDARAVVDDDDDDDDNNNKRGGGRLENPGSLFRPRSVKRVVDIFDSPKFYIDGPTANDVRQGRDGDCWLLAALCTLSNKPSLIERVCVARDEQVGVYGFVFHRDGAWFSEIIDDKLFLTKPDFDESFLERMLWEDRERVNSEEQYRRAYQSGSGALYFAQCEHADETWLPLLEKAYAKAHGDYAAIEGGHTGEGIEDLTGGVTSELYTTDILDKEYFWKEELMKVNDEFLFGCNTDVWGAGRMGDRNGIVELHAYSVMRAVEIDGERLVLLKNPWGKYEWKGAWSDGSKEWTAEWLLKLNHRFGDDGAFWISYKDLLRKYQAFDRTRLFGPEWKVTSLWTTLSVPWTLDYHNTHFAFTLAKTGPVVLVLSQLDDRYYRGLEGQYRFGLNFRLHKIGQEDYVVRTISPYCQTRSVNVELELEAGEYAVLLKVNATRDRNILPIEDVVRNNARDRRDKLVAVGMSYDLAHSKGQVTETTEEKKAKRDAEKRKKEKERNDFRKLIMKDRRDDHYLKVKARKRQQKRKAKEKAKAEAKKAAKEAARAEKNKTREEVDDAEAKSKDDAAEASGNSAVAATQETETEADSKDTDKNTPEDKETHVNIVVPDEISSPQTLKASSSEPSVKTPSTASNETPGDASPKSEKPTTGNSEKPTEESKAVEDKPDVKEEVEISSEDAIKETKEEEDDEKPSSVEPESPSSKEEDTTKPETELIKSKKDIPSSSSSEKDAAADSLVDEDGSDNDSDTSSISSLSSFSDLSDRELDIRLERMAEAEAEAAGQPGAAAAGPSSSSSPQQRPPPRQGRGGGREQDEDEPDEFESDPWNAVATVGLRVYHKVVGEEDRDREIVTLRVVRPNVWLAGRDEEKGEEGDDDDEGDKEKLEGKGEGKGKREDDKKKEEIVDELKSSQGLDVDDSSKDATLVGDQEQRKKSILSLIPPRKG